MMKYCLREFNAAILIFLCVLCPYRVLFYLVGDFKVTPII